MKQKLLEYLETLLKEAKNYYPDDDSKNEGYREAVEDIISAIRKIEV